MWHLANSPEMQLEASPIESVRVMGIVTGMPARGQSAFRCMLHGVSQPKLMRPPPSVSKQALTAE